LYNYEGCGYMSLTLNYVILSFPFVLSLWMH
jgi:hypothetical protein